MSQPQFSEQDHLFMRRAIELAAAEQEGEVPVGAVLVREGEIIAEGWNQSIAHHDATAHAEMQVLRKAGQIIKNYRLLDTILYVTLEPCPMCAGALLHSSEADSLWCTRSKIRRSGYSAKSVEHQAAYHYAEVEQGLLEQECRLQLQAFSSAAAKRKRH